MKLLALIVTTGVVSGAFHLTSAIDYESFVHSENATEGATGRGQNGPEYDRGFRDGVLHHDVVRAQEIKMREESDVQAMLVSFAFALGMTVVAAVLLVTAQAHRTHSPEDVSKV